MSDYSNFCGIDLANSYFSIHAVDQHGKVLLNKSVTYSKLVTTIANKVKPQDEALGLKASGAPRSRPNHTKETKAPFW